MMKKILFLSLVISLAGCDQVIDSTYRAVNNVVKTSGMGPNKVSYELGPVVGDMADDSVVHGKTMIALERQNHYQITVAEYGADQKKSSEAKGYVIPSGTEDAYGIFVMKIWNAIMGPDLEGIKLAEIEFENGLIAEFGAWVYEDLTIEQKRAIISAACVALENYIIDCPKISEAQCMTESGCNSQADNPEAKATAGDGLGGSHGAWQYRTRANLPGLSDSCRKERSCTPEERKLIWESIKCSHDFKCGTEQRIALTFEKNKIVWEARSNSEDDRKLNTIDMVLGHNGAESDDAKSTYLEAFNKHYVALGGSPL